MSLIGVDKVPCLQIFEGNSALEGGALYLTTVGPQSLLPLVGANFSVLWSIANIRLSNTTFLGVCYLQEA